MNRRLGIGVICLAIAGMAPLFARASAPVDWVLATMTVEGSASATPISPGGGGSIVAGPSGPGASLDLSTHVRPTGDGPVLLGFGAGFGPFHIVDVFDPSTGGVRLRTTDDLGGLDIEVTPAEDGTFTMGSGVGTSGSLSSRITLLLFVTNAVFDSHSVRSSGGSVPEVHTGSGSRVIGIAGPGTSGVAVDASAVAAGTSSVEASPTSGIVGGVTWGCTRCTVDWTTPDNHDGSFTQTNPPMLPIPVPLPPLPPLPPPPVPLPLDVIEGDNAFTGPAGDWTWSWTGANVRADAASPTTMGAYAPVGDLYRLFSERQALDKVVVGKKVEGDPKTKVEGEKNARTLANTGVGGSRSGAVLLLAAALSAAWLATTRRREDAAPS